MIAVQVNTGQLGRSWCTRVGVIALCLVLVGCSSGSGGTPSDIQKETAARPPATPQETQPTPTITAQTPSDAPAAAPTPVPTISLTPQDARASIFVIGNASPKLAAGELGVVTVVARATKLDGSGSLAIVVRNNTSQAVERITASGTIDDSAGNLIGSGSDQGLNPNHVEPGEIAFGYIYFEGVSKLPTGAKIDIQLESTAAADNTFENRRDLKGVRAGLVKGTYGLSLVGQLINQYTDSVGGPIGVGAACFDTSGHLLYTALDFATPDSLSPGQKASYSMGVSGNCPVYLVAGSGYSR